MWQKKKTKVKILKSAKFFYMISLSPYMMKGDIMLKYKFTGKNIEVTDALKDRAKQKIGRLGKLMPFDSEVNVKFSVVRQNNTVEVTIPMPRRMLRAEVTANDMFAALDSIVDVLEKQMIKYKSRVRTRSRRDASYKDELAFTGDFAETDDNPIVIDRTKHFPLKPMDAEEAVMEMEMLGHNFYVFRNGMTDIINVVYKRKDSTYGLIEPEY